MPAPFPGMDPFLEGQLWSDFHAGFISELRARLVPKLVPGYFVIIETSQYLLHNHGEELERHFVPDDAVIESGDWTGGGGSAVAVDVEPVMRTLPKPRTIRNAYLVIRSMRGRDVVTVIEVLSPWNKTGDGHGKYLEKREALLKSPVNLVELDLLRGGRRLPTVEPLPPGDLFAFVSRGTERPKTAVYAWSLRRQLPTIPIPLAPGDADVSLELQPAFDETYDRAGYRYSVDYTLPIEPPLSEADAEWARSVRQ